MNPTIPLISNRTVDIWGLSNVHLGYPTRDAEPLPVTSTHTDSPVCSNRSTESDDLPAVLWGQIVMQQQWTDAVMFMIIIISYNNSSNGNDGGS